MQARPGVPWIDSPVPYFSSHGYSELMASGLEYEITGKRIKVSIPKTVPKEEQQMILERLKQIGADGLIKFEMVVQQTQDVELIIVVE